MKMTFSNHHNLGAHFQICIIYLRCMCSTRKLFSKISKTCVGDHATVRRIKMVNSSELTKVECLIHFYILQLIYVTLKQNNFIKQQIESVYSH